MSKPSGTKAVTVVMIAENPPHDMPYPNRQLVLTEGKESIPLGRTSIRAAELTAAIDNGFIDSPIMSRKHAEVYADFKHERVYVKDVGSLHGTFLNSTKLARASPQALRPNDVLKFGTPVRNPPDGLIQPTSFKVGFDFQQETHEKSTKEKQPVIFQVPDDSSDSENSEMEDEIAAGHQDLKNCGVGAATDEPIDLTYDSPVMAPTSQTRREHLSIDAPSQSDIQSGRHSQQAPSDPIEIDSEDDTSMLNLARKMDEDIANHDAEFSDFEEESIRLSDSDSSASESSGDGAEEHMSLDDGPDYDAPAEHEAMDAAVNDYYDSDAAGIDPESSPVDEHDPADQHEEVNTSAENHAESSALPKMAPLHDSEFANISLPPIREWTAGILSDTWPRQSQYTEKVEQQPLALSPMLAAPYVPKQPEYADRAEFFIAREENKRRVAQQCEVAETEQADASDSRNSQAVNKESAWTQSGDRFLNSPIQSDPRIDEAEKKAPELDETSAYQFCLSKQKQAGTSVVDAAESRAKVTEEVQDELPTTGTAQTQAWSQLDEAGPVMATPPRSSLGKRKADEISDDEVADDGSMRAAIESLPSPSASEMLSSDGPPPSKRLRQVANVLGFAAVGGLAGGLAIFSALVASGPSFI